MLRSLLSALFALAFIAEATAQSAPATKTTTATKATTRTATARNTTMKPAATRAAAASKAASSGGRNDIGPGGNGAVGSTESADGKGQNVYAAPGMPVNVDNPKNVQGYNGPAPARTKSRTTLTPR
jgi:hypothetical protein